MSASTAKGGTDLTNSEPDTGQASEIAPPDGSKPARILRIITLAQRQGLLILLILLMAFLASRSPYFLTFDNLLSIGGYSGVLGLMALAQTMLIVSGGLDISVGSTLAVTSLGLVLLANGGMNVWLAALLMLVVGALIGALNGGIVVFLDVNPLITTLGTMSIFSGLAFMMARTGGFESEHTAFSAIGKGSVASVPMPFVIFIVATAIAYVVQQNARIGRSVYAIGGNPQASRLAGLHVQRVRFMLYVLSGISAALAGIVLTAQLSSTSADVGSAFTLTVITAVILGGASLAGGRGSVIGTFVAVLFLGVLSNGFTLLLMSSYTQTFILGIALIVAVLIDQTARKLSSDRSA